MTSKISFFMIILETLNEHEKTEFRNIYFNSEYKPINNHINY